MFLLQKSQTFSQCCTVFEYQKWKKECTAAAKSHHPLTKYIKTKHSDLKQKSINYYGIDLTFILGAGLGAVLTNIFDEKAVLVCCVILFIGFLVMFLKEDISIYN